MKVGIDLVEHKDIVNKDDRFIKRVLSENELTYYKTISNPKRRVEYLASRFAVKEAVRKCYETAVPFKDIEVENKKNGAPLISVKNKSEELQISLSHTDNYSIAIVILLINDDD